MQAKFRDRLLISMIAMVLTEIPMAELLESNLTCSLDGGTSHGSEHMLLFVASQQQRVPALMGVDTWMVEDDMEENADALLQRQGPAPPGAPKGKGKAKATGPMQRGDIEIPKEPLIETPKEPLIETPKEPLVQNVEDPKGPMVPKTEAPKKPVVSVTKDVSANVSAEAIAETTSRAGQSTTSKEAATVTTSPTSAPKSEAVTTTRSAGATKGAPILKGSAKNKAPVFKEGSQDLVAPRAEKLRNLAEGVMSLHSKFDWDYIHDGFSIDDSKLHAQNVFKLEEKHLKEGTEPTDEEMVEIEEAEIEESELVSMVSAESSEANNHLLTAHDLAQITKLPGMEDVGPNHALRSFQGDMVPADEEQLELFQRIAVEEQAADASNSESEVHRYVAGKKWPGGRVNYCFASDTPARVRHMFVAATMQYKRAVPCLSFTNVGWLRGSSTDDMSQQACTKRPAIFVMSHPQRGCYSYVGMVPQLKAAQLQLQDPGCLSVGTAVHELGHALGMAHEQSRPDRDTYIRIDHSNVKKGRERNFGITPTAGTHLKYDYLSVMHYDAYAFAVDRSKPTIYATTKLGGHDATQEIGQRMGLSKYDVDQLVLAYHDELAAGCRGSAFNGLGCVDRPGKNGEDVCSSQRRCRKGLMHTCCACGGGYKVQCYEGHPCPQPRPLPPEFDHDCIVNKANLFPRAGYPCVIFNRCFYPVEWQCPSLGCRHQTPPGVYRVQTCNGKVQTDICQLGKCNVNGLFSNKTTPPSGPKSS